MPATVSRSDYDKWLEELAPFDPSPERYHHNRTGEDNADAHHKRQIMGREVVVAITDGKLHLGPWEHIFYYEFDGRRKKRQEQLSIKAGADLAEQVSSRRSSRSAERRQRPGQHQQDDVRHPDQRRELCEVDQMIEPGDDRVPEDVNSDTVVEDVGRERPLPIA